MSEPRPVDTVAALRRMRLELARVALDEFPAAHVEAFHAWLHSLPAAPAGTAHDPVDRLSCSLTGDLDRLRWRADGSPEDLAEPMSEFLADWGATATEMDRLAAIGEVLQPARLGTWIESRAGGYDLGWAMPGEASLVAVIGLAELLPLGRLSTAPVGHLGIDVVGIARSMGSGDPTTRLVLVPPGDDRVDQATVAAELFAGLGAPLPADDSLAVLLDEPGGPLRISLWLLDDGIALAGLVVSQPPASALVRLAQATGLAANLDQFAALSAALGVDDPYALEAHVRASGEGFEVRYALD